MKIQKERKNKPRRWPWVIGTMVVLFGLWHLLSSFYLEEEKELRTQFRQSVIENFPEQAAEINATFGLFPFEKGTGRQLIPGAGQTLETVVLIHGLDDPGKAKIDLLPGSRFLTELNGRKYPEDVDMMIIAGITTPWNESDIDRLLGSVDQKVSGDYQKEVNAIGRYLTSMTHGLGDGLVTVESTRLEGIPHQTVNGTHLSMIRNITGNSQRIPPAVPLVVDRLKSVTIQGRGNGNN
jgi:hypothetical protein